MAGRPRKFDEEEVLLKATDVFWEKGYEAASTDDLLKAMNMGKGSFYLHFKGGKEELFIRTMEFRSERSLKKLRDRLNQSTNKCEAIKSLFFERLSTEDYFRNYGCYFGNTIVEMSNLNNEVKELAGHHLGKLESLFREVVSDAQREGVLASQQSPDFIAKYLINTWNGMNITKRMKEWDKQLEEVIKWSLKILD